MTNPVLVALSHLLRSIYGDSLAYRDGGYQGRYRDRVEAACALVEAGAVVLRPVTVMQGGRPYKRHMMAVVTSQEKGRRVTYHAHIPERGLLYGGDDMPTCDCPEMSIGERKRAPLCKHLIAATLMLALQAGFDALPPVTNHHADTEALADALA